jgi:hypothetical protein
LYLPACGDKSYIAMTASFGEEAMARLISALLIVGSLFSTGAFAQSVTNLTLGHSIAPLYGPWKFQVGDSPIDPATGKPVWAQADFDDSSWETVDLNPKTPLNPFSGTDGYQPGWAEKGIRAIPAMPGIAFGW